MPDEECGICHADKAKYKCPKCGIKYCSLACYKDLERHKDPANIDKSAQIEKKIDTTIISDKLNNIGDEIISKLATPSLNKIYEESPELKDLLKYNTVKFHLAKVHRILTTDVGGSGDGTSGMSSDMRNQLAIDYLNTLRYGGIHYNEAIEEFCQIYLAKIETNI